jgi:hypothetical protein
VPGTGGKEGNKELVFNGYYFWVDVKALGVVVMVEQPLTYILNNG